MKKTYIYLTAAVMIVLATTGHTLAAKPFVVDEKYPQKMATFYMEDSGLPEEGVNSLAFCGGKLYAGTIRGIFKLEGERWNNIKPGDGLDNVTRISCDGDALLVASRSGFFKATINGAVTVETLLLKETTTYVKWRGGWLVGTSGGLFMLKDGK